MKKIDEYMKYHTIWNAGERLLYVKDHRSYACYLKKKPKKTNEKTLFCISAGITTVTVIVTVTMTDGFTDYFIFRKVFLSCGTCSIKASW